MNEGTKKFLTAVAITTIGVTIGVTLGSALYHMTLKKVIEK